MMMDHDDDDLVVHYDHHRHREDYYEDPERYHLLDQSQTKMQVLKCAHLHGDCHHDCVAAVAAAVVSFSMLEDETVIT